jgi:hypothetical protein
VTITQDQLDGIVRRHTPKRWRVEYVSMRGCRGLAIMDRRLFLMAHAVDSRSWLFVFLHEVGHAKFKHPDTRGEVPSHVEEYEAERYAIAAMRHEGIPVPRDELADAKRNVRACIRRDRARGVGIDPRVEKWSRP